MRADEDRSVRDERPGDAPGDDVGEGNDAELRPDRTGRLLTLISERSTGMTRSGSVSRPRSTSATSLRWIERSSPTTCFALTIDRAVATSGNA